MANAVEVRVLGDASQLESALGRASSLLKKFGGDAVAAADAQVSAGVKTRAELEQMAAAYHVTADAAEQGSAKQQQAAALAAEADAKLAAQAKALADATMTAAQRNVAALVEQRDALERNVVEYQAIAAAAAKGSDEQIAANNLAAESARKLAAAYGEVSVAAKGSGAAASESGFARGVSSKLTGLGGWMAGPGFIAGAVGGLVIDKTVKAALAAADSVHTLDKALQDAHASVQALTPVLDRYDAAARKLGFDDQDTRAAQAELVTAFGATKKSLEDLNTAEDLARMKHETLAQATQELILLQEGNTRAAKQYGLAIPDLTMAVWHQKAAQDGLTVMQERGKLLYDELLPRIKDQAQAYANSPSGKIAEFQAEIQKLEETIGQGLLPGVDQYLTKIDDWLSKSPNQQRVTDDVKTAVHDLGVALDTAYQAMRAVLQVIDPIVQGLGGWKTVLEDIIALKFASMIAGWTSNLGKLIGAEGAGGILGAKAASAGLLGKLEALTESPWVVALALSIAPPNNKGQKALDQSGLGFLGHLPLIGNALQWDARAGAWVHGEVFGNGAGGGGPHGHIQSPFTPPPALSFQAWQGLHPGGTHKQYEIYNSMRQTDLVLKSVASGSGFGTGPGSGGKQKMLALAKQALGTPYLWGGNGPGGFDCSGLVQWAFANGLDIQLPHLTYDQVKMGQQVSPNHAQVGDVVFTNYGEGGNAGPGHEGLIVGFKNGQPIIESAPHKGASVRTDVGYDAFTGGGHYTVRDLTAKTPGSQYGPPRARVNNSADQAAASKKTAYHIPVELENEIRKAQARFAQDASKRNLDTLVALYKKEDELMKSHGAKLPALSEIVTAEKTYASKLSAQQVAAAKSAIAAIEKGTVGPEQALKLAQAAGASTQILLSDQRDVLAAYQAEAAKLEGKLKTTTGKARLEVAAALAKIDQQISSVKDQVVSSLKSLAQAASQKLASSAATVESDVVSAFEKQTQDYINGPLAAQYFQGKDPTTGLARQTPAEAALAAMQQADQQQQLQDALTTAQQQLALDEKAANGPGSMTDKNNAQVLVDGIPVGGSSNPKLTQDEKAVQAAERAITENNLASQATAERARADAAYATAVQQYTDSRSVQEAKLKAALDTWAAGLTTGATTIGGLSGIAASFGLTLSGLADPTTGIGYDFSVLSGAAQDAAAALAVLTTAAGGSNTSFDAAVAAGALPAIVAALHGGAIPGAATGADILREGLLYVHAGERVQPAHIVRGNQAATGPVTIELHVNKRKVASAIAPTLDKTVRVVLS